MPLDRGERRASASGGKLDRMGRGGDTLSTPPGSQASLYASLTSARLGGEEPVSSALARLGPGLLAEGSVSPGVATWVLVRDPAPPLHGHGICGRCGRLQGCGEDEGMAARGSLPKPQSPC